jgi:adenosylmethionine---8-amino-7-oxononanoate aminotransferase
MHEWVMDDHLPVPHTPLLEVDRAHIWHPFTQMREHAGHPPAHVVGAEGSELILASGARVLDGVSSWWTCIHGHCEPSIVAAIGAQAAKLDHVMFAGFTHAPAAALCERLATRVHPNLSKFFFSDNGSTAVEVALKMTFQAQFLREQPQRVHIGALHEAYHGDTLGAVGVGELGNFVNQIFSPLLLQCRRFHVPFDPRYGYRYAEASSTFAAVLAESIQALRRYFDEHGNTLCAFIAEPLIQGAGGMRPWPFELLQELRAQCTAHGVYLILDEVMTGFGRTGTFFAYEQAQVVPDVLCISKGLTGGTLPLAITCASTAIYDLFLGDLGSNRAFLHGHSYTGNPIACAAAAASLKRFDEYPVLTQAADLAAAIREQWQRVAQHPLTAHARVIGSIAACNLIDPDNGGARASMAHDGKRLHREALAQGLLVRPIGDCLHLLPPYCTTPVQVETAVDVLLHCLDSLQSNPEANRE